MDKRKRKNHVLWFGAALLTLLVFGLGYLWGRWHTVPKEDTLIYGVTEQNLNIQSILWNDYPAYRVLTFLIDGTVSFHTKSNGVITLNHLAEPDMLQEISREHNVFYDGKDLQFYDEVTYSLNSGKVTVSIPKTHPDNIICAITDNSYYLTFHESDNDYIAGCISAGDVKYMPWTVEEIRSAALNLDVYLPAFTLSKTYDSTKPLHQKAPRDGITLNKEAENYLSCILYNHTEKDWQYARELPHLELWYKGVWMELESPFDDSLTIGTLKPYETKQFAPPKETMEQYPTPFPGIYRLVIYGEKDEFIVSDSFFVQ